MRLNVTDKEIRKIIEDGAKMKKGDVAQFKCTGLCNAKKIRNLFRHHLGKGVMSVMQNGIIVMLWRKKA